MLPQTPPVLTASIRGFAAGIAAGTPVYVPVQPVDGALVNECFPNVDAVVRRQGGTRRIGWQIWDFMGVLLEAEFHAVWETPAGELMDVTPKQNGAQRILFLADPVSRYEGRQRDSHRRALTRSRVVKDMIAADRTMCTSVNDMPSSRRWSMSTTAS